MKKRLRVLITSIGSNTSICVLKGLRMQTEYDVYIVGTDLNNKEDIAGSFLCDSFYKIPMATDKTNYLESLARIVTIEAIDLLIPINDVELEVISQNIQTLTELTYVLISSYTTIETCNDKLKTFNFFRKIGIPTVQTISLNDLIDKTQLETYGLNYPFMAKPRKGLGSRSVFEITDKIDYDAFIRKISHPILQEKASGIEYTIDVFCDNETMVSAVPRKRIETRAGITYKGETELNSELIEYAARITKELKILGPANIQCFKSGDDIKFIEINPRFSGGLILSINSGVNSALFALKLSIGEKILPMPSFKIKRMCRYLDEVFYPSEYVNQVDMSLNTSINRLSNVYELPQLPQQGQPIPAVLPAQSIKMSKL